MSTSDIEAACAAFQTSIEGHLAKIQKKRHCDDVHLKQCRRLVRHATHVLRTLTAKRTSLKHAIAAFREATDEYVKRFSAIRAGDEGKRAALLQRWFATYIRLRDGFVLLESGERRHPHDGDDSKGVNVSESKFPSKLSNAYRKDGRTRAFSSANGYTGAAYDEFYYEEVGIKWRLLGILAKLGGKSRAWMEERTFDRDGSGAKLFEMHMDQHIDESQRLRAQLNGIQESFVAGINNHLASSGQTKKKERLRLVTDDKFERLQLGLVDIARQGNAFTVRDAGGSLPFNMTVQGWRKKFELEKPPQPKGETGAVAKKKRRVIIDDDSSDEDGDTAAYGKEPPTKTAPPGKKQKQPQPQKKSGEDGHDGLTVRKREATDISTSRGGNGKTASITEMKRSLGVDTTQLEQGREQMEQEQLRSKMAADDEDMQEEFLGEGLGAPKRVEGLVNACLSAWTALQKDAAFGNDVDLMREAQDRVADVFGSLAEWKERFQAVREMREKISKGKLDECSDHAYALRENFREALMYLGIDLLTASDFFSSKLRDIGQGQPNRSASARTSPSSLEDALSDICEAYLRFAEEVFRTALGVVIDQERCESKSNSVGGVARHWEKGQHFLLRGRAHFNVGRAVYELAQHYSAGNTVLPGQSKPKELLEKARKEFGMAAQQSKALRRNTVVIHGHANAKDISDHSENTWAVEAMIQSVEASGLEALASGLHITCFWKLDRAKEAKEAFDGFFGSVVASDVLNYAGPVAHDDIAEVLEEMYFVALRHAGLAADSLESLVAKVGWNAKVGDDLLRVFCKAMTRAAAISEKLLTLADQNSLDGNVKERILSKTDIEKEEREICNWWEIRKAQAQRNLSDVVQSARANMMAGLSRTEVAREVSMPSRSAQFPRRTYTIQDNRALQSKAGRASRVKKKKSTDDQTVSDRFNAEFGSGNTAFEPDNANSPVSVQQSTATKYRPFGNENIPGHKRCCPPLPDWMSPDLRRALEEKLGDTLPSPQNMHH